MNGKLNHFELYVKDAIRASQFFGSLFGWHGQRQMDGAYYLVAGDPSCGLVSSPDGAAPPRVYFDADDLEGAAARVRELGGTAAGIQSAPGYGRWCRCTDDQGTEFALFQKEISGTQG